MAMLFNRKEDTEEMTRNVRKLIKNFYDLLKQVDDKELVAEILSMDNTDNDIKMLDKLSEAFGESLMMSVRNSLKKDLIFILPKPG